MGETLPPSTSAQLTELIALIKALQLSKEKTTNIYIDFKYVFPVLYAHAVLWKEQGLLTTEGFPIKHSREILNFLKAVLLPKRIAVISLSWTSKVRGSGC
jgi:ribonuclease HI